MRQHSGACIGSDLHNSIHNCVNENKINNHESCVTSGQSKQSGHALDNVQWLVMLQAGGVVGRTVERS